MVMLARSNRYLIFDCSLHNLSFAYSIKRHIFEQMFTGDSTGSWFDGTYFSNFRKEKISSYVF